MKCTVIGIAGGTGSGKSTFTARVKAAFPDKVAVLYHDNYMAAAYTTLIAYMSLAYFQMICAKKVCKENGIEEGKIFSDERMLIIAIATVVLCLTGIALYHSTVLRYIAILGVSVFSISLVKKYNVLKMLMK